MITHSSRMGNAGVILALMTTASVIQSAPQTPCNGGLDCLINQVAPANGNAQSIPNRIPSTGPVQPLPSSTGSSGAEDDCVCVPYYQCQNNTISTDGVGLIDIRLKGSCDNYLDICCKPPAVLKPEDKVTPAPVTRKGCGQRNPDGVGFRITGDQNNESQFGEFPWMVAILRETTVSQNKGTEKLNIYQCGGSLIHEKVVLTAAHCVVGRSAGELKVRAGEWDTQTKTEILPHQDRDVEAIVIHEHYHSGALYNDVALLVLKTRVELAENIDIVCLPEYNENFDGSRCFASGWGKDMFGKEGQYQVILKKLELPIVPSDRCQNDLRETRLGHYYILNESFLCAGGEPGKDTCKGDGGSPLVCPLKNDPSRYTQVGIVAWGIGCGEKNTPGVYANVPYLRRWINAKVQENLRIENFNPQ